MTYTYYLLILIKFICLSIGIAYSFGNVVRAAYGIGVSTFQSFAMAFSIAGFIILQFCL